VFNEGKYDLKSIKSDGDNEVRTLNNKNQERIRIEL
jgi:hypothetical protein